MPFIDLLALEEATLLFAAVIIGYAGVMAFVGMRQQNAAGVSSTLKGVAVPLGAVGAVATFLGLWGEIAWPLPGSYNIFFGDVYLLFGATMVVVAVSVALGLKLQYAGLFALVAGGTTIAYGWNGYVLGMTKDPLETFLLYGAFGLAGVLAMPATLAVDHFFAHSATVAAPAASSVSAPTSRPAFSLRGATRAVQPITPGATDAAEPETSVPVRLRLPVYINVAMGVFVVSVALAGIAALLYLDSTLPAHLAKAP